MKRMGIAFLLNLFFACFELVGGLFTGSVAILSDALHDLGDSLSIGLSLGLEKVSKRPADGKYTYGYLRFSVLGSLLTYGILAAGSLAVLAGAAERLMNPVAIRYDGMILLAVFGVGVNFLAAWFTHGGESLNRRALSLHMLEDVLGWVTVLAGAVVMKLTGAVWPDAVLSMGVALFILSHAGKGLLAVGRLFLEKVPAEIHLEELKAHLEDVEGVAEVHHLHLRSLDGFRHEATLHAVITGDAAATKAHLREELAEHGAVHTVIETERVGETCPCRECVIPLPCGEHHHHHHH